MWKSLISLVNELLQCHRGHMLPNIIMKPNYDLTRTHAKSQIIPSVLHEKPSESHPERNNRKINKERGDFKNVFFFNLVLLFYGISAFLGYSMPKSSL